MNYINFLAIILSPYTTVLVGPEVSYSCPQVVLESGERATAYTYFLVKPLEEDRRPSKAAQLRPSSDQFMY
jgi:hypothetical protein